MSSKRKHQRSKKIAKNTVPPKREPGDDLTEEQRQDINKAFELFDEDGSGALNICEIRNALFYLGNNPTEEEINNIFENLDGNKDGVIDKGEFTEMMKDVYMDPRDEEDELRAAFKVFDKDGSNTIDLEELKGVILNVPAGEKFTDAEIEKIFKQVDADGNGTISIDEFTEMCTSSSLL